MKGIVRAILYGLVALVAAVAPAHAVGFLDETVKALASSPVYVAPDTDGTTSDTAVQLKGRLLKGDRIVIVMWPSSGGNIDDTIRQLDEATKHRYIIGMSIGNEVRATASFFPAGTAADEMKRAKSVGTNTVETLGTFIQNVHSWQRKNPEATPPEPEPEREPVRPWYEEFSVTNWIMLALAILLPVTFFSFLIKRGRRSHYSQGDEWIKFRSPDPVLNILERLANRRHRIQDESLRALLTQAGNDTEEYFRRLSLNKSDSTEDVQMFTHHLEKVDQIVSRYIDIQDHPRYYEDPEALMNDGREAISGFAQFVLSSIQRNNFAELAEFDVNTDILSAERLV